MFKGVVGAPAGVALFLIFVAVMLHRHNRERKTFGVAVAVVAFWTLAAFFGVVALTPSMGTVWAFTENGPGLLVLLVIFAGSAVTLVYHFRHRNKFHAHVTPAVGAFFAGCAALIVLNFRHVSGHALGAVAASWRSTGTAVSSGAAGKVHAAPAAAASGSHGLLLAGAAVAVVLGVLRMARSAGGRKRTSGGPAGIPGGPGKALGK